MQKTIIADIAAAAGVSTATVDRVLNRRGGVSPKEGRARMGAQAAGRPRSRTAANAHPAHRRRHAESGQPVL